MIYRVFVSATGKQVLVKKMITYAAIFICAVLFIALYARNFEWNNIYFPDRLMEATPASINLPYEDVYFKTSDDIKLNGWFIPSEESRGTLLFCHGNAGNISGRIDVVRILNSLGLDVFIFDYRGYGRSTGRASEKGTYLDAQAAYKFLLNEKNISAKNIIVYGKSLGGAMAIDLACRSDVRAVISDSAFTSVADMAKELYPFLPVRHILTIKYESLTKIKKLKMPKLIIHSEGDEIVPFSHGEKLFEYSQEPKQFYRMRGGHNEGIFMHEDEFKRKIDDFLKEKCGF